MSRFYTNVQLAGNTILYRGYEDGQRVQSRAHFSPTLFVTSNKEEKYKTLEGDNVRPVKFESSREAREFIQQYQNVEGFKVHGYERFVYQFITQEFPDEVDYTINHIPRQIPIYWLRNYGQILDEAITPALSLMWAGEADAQQAMDQAVQEGQKLLQGRLFKQ